MNIFVKIRSLFAPQIQNKADIPSVKKTDDELDPFYFAQFAGLLGANTNAYSCVPAVKLAIDFITRNAAQLEIGFFDFKDNKEVFKDTGNIAPLVSLFNNPAPNMDARSFIEACIGYIIYRGEVVILLEQSWGSRAGIKGALPAQLRVVDPANCTALNYANGDIVQWSYKGRTYQSSEVMHIKTFNPDDNTRGFDTQRALQDLLKSALYSMRSSARFYENGATPDFVLSSDRDINQTTVNQIKENWNTLHKGVNNKHKVAILGGGLKPQQLSQGTTEAQLKEAQATDERIYSSFYAQKALLNITDTTNYATFQGQMKVFWQCTVMPFILKIQCALNERVVRTYDENIELRFKYDNVPALAEDYKDKIEQAKGLLALGYPLNMINDRLNLGMDTVEWGDEWWINMGQMPASDYGSLFSDNSTQQDNSDQSETGSKSLKQTPEEKRAITVWKRFDITQVRTERILAQRTGRFLSEQKGRLSKILQEGGNIDWKSEEQRLYTALAPAISDGVKEGIRLGNLQIPSKAQSDDTIAARYLKKVGTRIEKINETTRRKVDTAVNEGLAAGNTLSEIVDTLAPVFDKARARLIARTEATGSLNGGTAEYFAEIGAKKQWLTTMDGNERESHAEINGEVREASERFSNGLLYPSDPTAAKADEVCNCRCTILGVA